MKSGIKFLCITVICLVLFSCTTTQNDLQSEGLQKVETPHFSILYPHNAKAKIMEPASPTISKLTITGPEVSIKPGDADWVFQGSAYELTIAAFENPEQLDAKTWASRYILKEWQKAKAANEPLGYFPVKDNGTLDEELTEMVTIAGHQAFLAKYFGGDAMIHTYYLAKEKYLLAITVIDNPLPNQPIALVQQDVYALLLNSLCLK